MINIGIIGCGYWGPNLIRNFTRLPNCNIVVCCDRDVNRLEHMKQLYADIKKLLKAVIES